MKTNNLTLTKICSKCKQDKILDDFYPKLRGKLNKSSECKECFKTRIPVLRKRNKGKPKNKSIKMRNGLLTFQQRDELLGKQNNACFICTRQFIDDVIPCVDHCHVSGEIRGMLCRECNSGLGFFRDNVFFLIRAIEYISNPKIGYKRLT